MSIRIKLTIIMLAIGLLPTLLVSTLVFINISSELTRRTESQLTSAATNQQQKITALIQQRQEESTKLANQFDLQSGLNSFITTNGKNGRPDLYNLLLSKKVASPDIQAISLVDLKGTVITSTVTGAQGTTLKPEEFAVVAGQESAIKVKEDPRDGINKLYSTTKVNVNKKESGYLNMVFRVDDILATMQDYSGLGSTGETILASKNADGNYVSLFPLRFDTDAALKTQLTSVVTDGENHFRQTTDYRKHAVILTSKAIGFSDWVLVTKIDLDEALASINQLRTTLLIIVLLSSVALTALSLYLTRYFTNPILRVSRVAESFGRGDFNSRVDVQKRSDEIGALGKSINAMGLNLQELVTSLESQRNRLSIILNSTSESILAIDKQGKILLANAATNELTQLGERAIVGQNISDLFAWKKNMQNFAVDYIKEGTNTYNNVEYTDAADVPHYLKIIVSKIEGEQPLMAPQTIVTIHDETKSRDLDNMKVDFVSMAAHELRTPLAATRGYLELISFKEGEGVAPDVKNYLQQALKSTAELGSLIDNLLGVTRIERGTLTLRPDKVDIADDIQQAIRNATFTANDKRIALSYDGPTSECYVIADQIALHEVINNLINNAIKYTNSGGSVNVLLGREGKNYVIRFKDTGIGIPKQSLANLFTKFYRVHGGLNSGSTGTGLGLFISKSIIERHGGTISVESEEGVGSTFIVSIPVLDETKLAELKAHEKQKHTTRGSRGWTTKNIAR